jgi:acyl-CoA reductase-like NAD-dependent aldehyde dehydrogenase
VRVAEQQAGHAQIVSADADIDVAVDRAVRRVFELTAAGNACVGPLLVHEDVHDEFVARLRTRAAKGDLGSSLASRMTRERVIDEVDDAWTRGAEIHQYGCDDGLFQPATVATGVTRDMRVAEPNASGPVAPIIKVSTATEFDFEASRSADDPPAPWQIVLADADIDAAVEGAVVGCFRLTGRGRIAAARLLVHSDVHDEFAAALETRAGRLRFGDLSDDSTEVGPLSDQAAWERVVDHVEDAWTRGAQVHQYGPSGGLYCPATIVTGVGVDMKVARSNTFGPVAPVIRIASVEEAIAIVNRSGPSPEATLWTNDGLAAERVTTAVWPGTLSLGTTNDVSGHISPVGPHG